MVSTYLQALVEQDYGFVELFLLAVSDAHAAASCELLFTYHIRDDT
jgi:hypothetical protein